MAEEGEVSRSVADELAENISKDIKTPVDIFFLALFVFGVLSVAATTLVGPCGNVTDEALLKETRVADYQKGAVVVVTRALLMDKTVVLPGACGVVEQVDEEAGTATIRVLAKSPPGYIDEIVARAAERQEEQYGAVAIADVREAVGSVRDAEEASLSYRPPHALVAAAEFPLRTLLFFHEGSPASDVDVRFITPVATQPYTNSVRAFFLSDIYVVLLILTSFLILLVFIGSHFEDKRKTWYKWHTRRSLYLSRLTKDREKMRQLQDNWGKIKALSQSGDVKEWDRALVLLEETLEGVLENIGFAGEDLSKRLQGMTKKELHTIDQLWQAHSLILRVQGKVEDEKEVPPLTAAVLAKIVDIYRESFIWLGLLPHWENGSE